MPLINSKAAKRAVDIATGMLGQVNRAVPVITKAGGGEVNAPPAMATNTSEKVQGPSHSVDTAYFSDIFDRAIAHHLSLPTPERTMNSRAAGEAAKAWLGKDADGRPKPLLSDGNAKLKKAGQGYDDVPPLQLSDGRGVSTFGVALSPATKHGSFKVCPNSGSCEAACLGKTSGNYGASYEKNWPRINSSRRTNFFMNDPASFAVRLHDEITREKILSQMNGDKLAVRLNVLSDIDPRIHQSIIKSHPDVDFYDYTKMKYKPVAPNHHYTYSSTGVSQDGVNNPHQNWPQMRSHLEGGKNVAMVFTHPDHLPEEVHDAETGNRYRVVDGTTHDYRPLDAQPPGQKGVIVGLKNLSTRGARDRAHIDTNGFMVKYDPQLQMALGAKGKEIKKAAKDMNGNTIPTNRSVTIKPQSKPRFQLTRNGQ